MLIPYDSVEKLDGETDLDARTRVVASAKRALGGRLTSVEIALRGERIRVASVYAPAEPRLRPVFFKLLKPKLKKRTLIGIDANCVPDVTIDVMTDATSPNNNNGADELAQLTADLGLEDVAREQLDGERLFTAHRPTAAGICRSRIDRFYTPTVDGLLWSHGVCHDFWPTYFTHAETGARFLDHIAVQVSLVVAKGVRGTDVKRQCGVLPRSPGPHGTHAPSPCASSPSP